MPNVLLLESIADGAKAMLLQAATVFESKDPYSGGEIADLHDIHAIICRGKGDVSPALIDKCPNLKVVARCGVGVDNIDTAYAKSKNVKVVNAPGSNADTVAEQTMALMLLLQRQLYPIITQVKEGDWNSRVSYGGDEIRGKKLGIIGLGNIGMKVAKLASAFGMTIQYWAREDKKNDFKFVNLEELLSKSDIVSLHLPLNDQTKNLIDKKMLSLMKPTSLLINTGRGAVINETDLANALEKKQITGFAADVMATQPPSDDNPLLSLPNVLLTPHISSLTKLTYDEMCELSVQNVLSIMNDESIDNKYIVNR